MAAEVTEAELVVARPFALDIDEVVRELHADRAGLTAQDAEARLAVAGRNPAAAAGFVPNATRTVKRPEGDAADAIDYTISPADGTPPSFRPAVFEVDGDTFKICLTSTHNGPRPTDCTPVLGTTMYVLKRVTDK